MATAKQLATPEWWDIEVSTLTDMLEKGMWEAHEVSHIQRQVQERICQLKAGLGSPTQIWWTIKVQKEVDEFCRIRHDRQYGWMLDRFVEELGCWHPVGYIGVGGRAVTIEENGASLVIVEDDKVRPDLCQFLRARDMQRPGYIEEKRESAKEIEEANAKAAQDKIDGVVDGMSDKRVKEFIQVEKAMQTGESITLHGASRVTWDKLEAANLKYAKEHGKLPEAAPESHCDNPGMHPKVFKRRKGGKHLLEK